MTVRAYSIARELVIGPGRKYVDWLPYDVTETRAEVFFQGGRPFTVLKDPTRGPMRTVLNRGVVLRNAIAHKSRHSLLRFEREVVAGTPLAAREKSPAGFLRGTFAVAPPQTRFESYVSGMLTVGRLLTA
jgi:hypothetical protein